jgi:hypothetical protein
MLWPRVAFPDFEPCLPRRADKPPRGDGWLHEIKHDGFRMLVRRDAATLLVFIEHSPQCNGVPTMESDNEKTSTDNCGDPRVRRVRNIGCRIRNRAGIQSLSRGQYRRLQAMACQGVS